MVFEKLYKHKVNTDDLLHNPMGRVRVYNEHIEAKEMVANEAFRLVDKFLDGFKDGGLTKSKHMKPVEFYNQTDKDLDTAYRQSLKVILREVMDELDRIGG